MRKRYLFLVLLIIVSGCSHNNIKHDSVLVPKDMPNSDINKSEISKSLTYPLPKDWDVYRKNLDDLIGIVVFVLPEGKDPEVKGTIIKPEAFKDIKKDATENVLYSSKVDKKVGGDLSFIAGRVEMADDHLYDFTLKESNIATLKPDLAYIDSGRLNNIWQDVPDKYEHAYWITGVKHTTLSIRDFKSIKSNAESSYSLIKVGTAYFTSDETTSLKHVIYVIGTDISNRFGTKSSDSSFYVKRTNPPDSRTMTLIESLSKIEKIIEPSLEEEKEIQKAFLKIKSAQLPVKFKEME